MKNTLNAEQLQAAQHVNGPCLVTAGPGTGKTHTMTARVSFLINDHKIAPEKILIMTFTKKAANEIKERLAKIDARFSRVKAGTFHSIAIDIIRKFGGFKSLSIIDDMEESGELMRYFMDKFKFTNKQIEDTSLNKDSLHEYYKLKSSDSALRIGPKMFKKYADKELEPDTSDAEMSYVASQFIEEIQQLVDESQVMDCLGLEGEALVKDIFKKFNAYKIAKGILSFDDCITVAADILAGSKGQLIAAQYSHVSVDEYQDSNKDQVRMLDLLCLYHKNIFVVGDDKQSIYCWRGASPKAFEDFIEKYNPVEIGLVRNYRSTQNIIQFVNDVAKTRQKKSLELISLSDKGSKPQIIGLGDITTDREKSSRLQASAIFNIITRTSDYNNTAVLFRSHGYGTSVNLQVLLSNARIPYIVVGGRSFTDYVIFKKFKAIMRMIDNPSWTMPWIHILSMFTGIGETSAISLARSVSSTNDIQEAFKELGKERSKIGKRALAGFSEAMAFFSKLRNVYKGTPSMEVANLVLGHLLYMVNKQPYENIPENINWQKMIHTYPDIKDFKVYSSALQAIYNLCDNNPKISDWIDAVNMDDDIEGEKEKKAVTLSTIHGAKGKEWDTVIVAELDNGLMPNKRSVQYDKNGVETTEYVEERNVFYVAISRAKKNMYITHINKEPSIFLEELFQ